MASGRSLWRVVLVGLLGALTLPSAADAAIPNIPNGAGGNLTCTVQTGANAGERHCSGIFTTFDGAPIDINVGFPPAPASGPDGDFPVVGLFHGWGGSKLGPNSGGWIDAGYAFFSMSDRGWGMSCGGADPKRTQPVCANGYNHLMDTRFEVRDAQEVFEALADRAADGATGGEGLIHPQRIGVTGGSYGGGISMALAALNNRKMIQDNDGTLVPWVSDGGKQMQIAAAQPDIPWTDLAYSLQPNGHTLDYVADAPYMQRGRIGVMKQSFVAGLYAIGQATSNYAPPGTDPDADLVTWFSAINAGEPYDTNPLSQDIVDEVTTHHSSYYIDDSTPPAPLLISNGWTDDLFPADEAIRFYNRTRTNNPGTPVSLIFTDHGHQRGQNKGPDATFRNRETHAWFDHYVKGQGSAPFEGVQTLTQACNGPSVGSTGQFDDPDSDQPFRSPTWAALAPGEVRFVDPASKVIASSVSDQAGNAFDPISGGGACATAPAGDQAGAASYHLAPALDTGYTLMGSPTIIADINSPSPTSQLAVRLLDVEPGGIDETLVARGLYRPEVNSGTESTRQVFQLHPNGWRFEDSHSAKLELLPADQPYGRNSNGQAPITVSNLELRLPVLEEPGTLGVVGGPSTKVVPDGYQLASDYLQTGYPRPKSASPLRVALVPAYQQCTEPDLTHGPPLAFESCSAPDAMSPNLTVGTPDANGGTAHSVGAVRLATVVGVPGTPEDEADVKVDVSLSDVREASGLGDYTGELNQVTTLRITDRANGSGGEAGTVEDLPLAVGVPCAGTPETTKGANCSVSTTIDALAPGAVPEGQRSIWALGQVQVFDGGPDGIAATAGNSLFAVQGIFVP
ncbi:MAG: acetylxylan esterase [Solirubrobacterales bacterium]